jgi:hypothetical protein
MSRGPGYVQCAIAAYFEAEPDNAFLLSELCERIYPRTNRIEKKHRVAVARAAKLISTLAFVKRETLGCELVFYDPLNVMSYAMARLKADAFGRGEYYRNNDPRKAEIRARLEWLSERQPSRWNKAPEPPTESELRERLAPGGPDHKHVVEGGAWWRLTEMEKARRRGDVDTYNRLEADRQAALNATRAQIAVRHLAAIKNIFAP